MNKIVFHIGPHKTASTYIQKKMYDNRISLFHKGLSYSDKSLVQWGHHRIPELLCRNEFEQCGKVIGDIVDGNKVNFLSSENFDRLSLAQVKALKDISNAEEFEIVFVYRNLISLLISSWQESVKHGGVESWHEFCLKQMLFPYSSEALKALSILDCYSEVFGKDSLKIINFDAAVANGDDVFELMLKLLSIDSDGLDLSVDKVNVSTSYSLIEILRILNMLYFEKYRKSPFHFLRVKFFDLCARNEIPMLDDLLEKVERSSNSISFDKSFYFEFLQSQVLSKYSSCFVNGVEGCNLSERKFNLPNDKIVLDVELMNHVRALFDLCEKDNSDL